MEEAWSALTGASASNPCHGCHDIAHARLAFTWTTWVTWLALAWLQKKADAEYVAATIRIGAFLALNSLIRVASYNLCRGCPLVYSSIEARLCHVY